MRFRHSARRWLSSWLMGVLLTVQWATVAYACPTVPPAVMAMADMPGCDGEASGIDPDQRSLCQAHCQQGSQNLQPTPAAEPAPQAPLLLAVLDWSAAALLPPWLLQPAAWAGEVHAGAPPAGAAALYLRLQVLRR